LHSLGRTQDFNAEFERYRVSGLPEAIARIYAWSGNGDAAFQWLEEMVRQDGPASAAYASTDLYAKLKSDPRMLEFLKRNSSADEDLSKIQFNPKLPPDILAADSRH
jgi:hypothetical protein